MATNKVDRFEGRSVGRYMLRRALARGGMGSVYLAQLAGARGFRTWVAIKLIHAHLADDRRFVSMLLDEARLAARIRHPNVCAVADFGEHEGLPYLAMEYLHGESLASAIRYGLEHNGLPPWFSARVVSDAARGLHAAHEAQDDEGHPLHLVHRDVSPQNIIVLYDGIAKVVDFGVARARGRLSFTRSGELKGKLAYMSPEQVRGEVLDRRADVWSLGVVLWETTLGQRLFSGESEGQTVMNVLQKPIPRPRSVDPNYPPILESAVMAALQRDVVRRTASAEAFAQSIDEYFRVCGEPAGAGQIADWMQKAFAEQKRARDAWLTRPEEEWQPIETPSIGELTSPTISKPEGTSPIVPESDSSVRERPSVPKAATYMSDDTAISLPLSKLNARSKQVAIGLLLASIVLIAFGAVAFWDYKPAVVRKREKPLIKTQTSAAPATTASPRIKEPPPVVAQPSAAPVEESPEDIEEPEPRGATRSRAKGKLNLLSIPTARVYWRGKLLGQTPMVERIMPAGVHKFRLRALRGKATTSVRIEIEPGKLTRKTVQF